VLASRRIFGTDRGRQNDNLNGNPADVVFTHMIALTDSPLKDDVGGPGNKAENQVYHTGSGNTVSLLALEEAAEGVRANLRVAGGSTMN
jgi:hypothetical protein